MTDIIQGKRRPHVGFKDDSQSPVYGREIFELSATLSTGLDYDLFRNPHLSDWLRANYWGDFTSFMKILQDTKNVKLLLSMRESLFNITAVFHVVHGARKLYSEDGGVFRKISGKHDIENDGHMKILEKLLSLGAEVDPRDIGGRTPLSVAVTTGSNHVTLKLAERLIKAGADVNSKDRMGFTPLHKCAEITDLEPAQLLLDNGADPDIKNNFGESVYDVCAPSMKDMLGKAEKKRVKEERDLSRNAVGGSFRQCGVCGVGVGEKVMKRCTGKYTRREP